MKIIISEEIMHYLLFNDVFDTSEHIYFIPPFVGFNVKCHLKINVNRYLITKTHFQSQEKTHLYKITAVNILTLIWYLRATSSSKGTMLSTGSPLSSFISGGYQETAMTPENKYSLS